MCQCAWNWFEDAVLEKTLLDTPGAAYFRVLHVSGHDRLYKWLIFLSTPGRAGVALVAMVVVAATGRLAHEMPHVAGCRDK
jgi:hypothetical protein